jgi:hypothetical protein
VILLFKLGIPSNVKSNFTNMDHIPLKGNYPKQAPKPKAESCYKGLNNLDITL